MGLWVFGFWFLGLGSWVLGFWPWVETLPLREAKQDPKAKPEAKDQRPQIRNQSVTTNPS